MNRGFSAVKDNDKKNEGKNKQPEIMGYGVAFMKTRAADFKIRMVQVALEDFGAENGIEIVDVIVDQTASRDIDRDEINTLCLWIETAPISVLFVYSLNDITDDVADLDKFKRVMAEKSVVIFCLENNELYLPDDAADFGFEGSEG